ncbi:MAG: ATP-binding protein [Desulfovibrio sp.]|nr:MAG: ATP-binding protein [Desulfovibrio sp.]
MSDNQCGSCSSANSCSSAGEGACSPEDKKLADRLARIKNIIVVLSGKGGVGKSAVAANLAVGLSLAGKHTGLLDVDVHGPSIPRILGLTEAQIHAEPDYVEPVPFNKNLWVISLGFMLPSPSQAVIWRGPVKIGVIRQFVQDVTWGDLDYLIVDCPPGTGDEPLSAIQTLGPRAKALIVTTPQSVAIDDVRRSVSFCAEVETEVLGLVENMSGYVCSHCGQVENIFQNGGGQDLAKEMNVPFLGAIPLDPQMVLAGDNGEPLLANNSESPAAKAMDEIVQKVMQATG